MSKTAIFGIILHLNSPTQAFPWDDLRKIFRECQRMAKVPNGIETIAENFNRLSKVHESYRRQTDRRNGDSIYESHIPT